MGLLQEMKTEILTDYPSVRTLSWRKRIKALFAQKYVHRAIRERDTIYIRLSARLVNIDGKEYFYEWGGIMDYFFDPPTWTHVFVVGIMTAFLSRSCVNMEIRSGDVKLPEGVYRCR